MFLAGELKKAERREFGKRKKRKIDIWTEMGVQQNHKIIINKSGKCDF